MAPHSSTLAWKIPWMEEPGRLQSMGLLRVRQDSATSLSLFTFMHWRRKWQPTAVFLPGESQEPGSPLGCRLWGSHRVRHNWSDLAVSAAKHSLVVMSMIKNAFFCETDLALTFSDFSFTNWVGFALGGVSWPLAVFPKCDKHLAHFPFTFLGLVQSFSHLFPN